MFWLELMVAKYFASLAVVVVFPDHGSRYLSKIYSDEWMNNQGFYDRSFYQPKKNTINYI